MQTVHENGFATSGVRDIAAAAGVALGSFSGHFESKEAFGVAVLDHYFDALQVVIAQTLNNDGLTPMDRLDRYFETISGLFAASGWRYGCLAGNMGLEAAEHSEAIRLRLGEIFAEWTVPFVQVIRVGQETGEFPDDLDAEGVGAALLEAWHGAMLRMKIERSPASLDRFRRLTLPALAGPIDRA